MKCKKNSGNKQAYLMRPKYSLKTVITFMCSSRLMPMRMYTIPMAMNIANRMLRPSVFPLPNDAGFAIHYCYGNLRAVAVSVSYVKP